MGDIAADILRRGSIFSTLIPLLIVLILNYRIAFDKVKKLLLIFVLLALFFEWLANYILHLELSNLPLLHVYTAIEFLLITLIFYYGANFSFSKRTKDRLIYLFLLFTLVNGFFIEGFENFNTNVRAIESIILILFPLLFFYHILKDFKIQALEKEPMFWISVAVLIYFSGNLITFIISNFALQSDKLSFTIWGIHAVLNIFKNILFAIALWVNPVKQNSLPF